MVAKQSLQSQKTQASYLLFQLAKTKNKLANKLQITEIKLAAQRIPPPPPSLGPFVAPLSTLPLPCVFWDLAVTSAFFAFFSSFVFLILSLISLHNTLSSQHNITILGRKEEQNKSKIPFRDHRKYTHLFNTHGALLTILHARAPSMAVHAEGKQRSCTMFVCLMDWERIIPFYSLFNIIWFINDK